ncbi:GGDEF domain-containing protein [Pseudoxanthomonas japonensis]|jgi:diguanylate cyclase|uniref:GGDEF domain-containing protein n=1 Tax=Pseudoxanthomonas japonensis TaxID=69284 RepID=UPI001BCEB968|nr:GGDEF domain-containing protein [Pseudoxanthomonas japonensis]
MPHEIVHTIGSTIYFVLFALFLWVRGIPRTNSGAGWWATAMLFALLSRICAIALFNNGEVATALSLYAALNVLEKACLLIGIARFTQWPIRSSWLWIAIISVEAWIFLAWMFDGGELVRGFGVALFNASMLSLVAWIAYAKRSEVDTKLMILVSVVSMMLALHWASAFIIIEQVPAWLSWGFLLGTSLVLAQYFILLVAILRSFQRRLVEAESKALDMAFQDPLTGLSNQRYMSALFEQALILANRPHQFLAIIFIDVDNFKPINDKAGHRVGDEVLKILAARLRSATRSTDICARVGGDEFVAICTQLESADHVGAIAEKLLNEFRGVIVVEGNSYILGASIGISMYPIHGKSLSALLDQADRAMYEVKATGKSGYRIHSS